MPRACFSWRLLSHLSLALQGGCNVQLFPCKILTLTQGAAELGNVKGGPFSGTAGSSCIRMPCDPLCVPSPPDLAQLRKKFEEDKQRIELMRAQRKFRPY